LPPAWFRGASRFIFAHGREIAFPEPLAKEGGDALYTADAQNLSESEIDGSREWRLAG
jgi:hypothetical protein